MDTEQLQEIQELLQTVTENQINVMSAIEQMNDNIVTFAFLIIALFGVIIGFMSAKELLKIWIH